MLYTLWYRTVDNYMSSIVLCQRIEQYERGTTGARLDSDKHTTATGRGADHTLWGIKNNSVAGYYKTFVCRIPCVGGVNTPLVSLYFICYYPRLWCCLAWAGH